MTGTRYSSLPRRVIVYLKRALILVDFLCINATFFVSFHWGRSCGTAATQEVALVDFYAMAALFNMVSLVAVLHLRLYANMTVGRLENLLRATWKSVFLLLAGFAGCLLVEYRFAELGFFLAVLATLVVAYAALSRFLVRYVYRA